MRIVALMTFLCGVSLLNPPISQTADTLLQYFPDESLDSIIIDPSSYLSDMAKDFIYQYMLDMPKVNGKQVKNILIVVD